MDDIRLSDNFWLSEMAKSDTADRLDIDNWPTDDVVIEKLTQVAKFILQPIRNYFDIPFAPSSGYRCLELNRALRSKDSSQHPKGEAVDIEIPGIANYDLAVWVRDNLDYDQLILEFYTSGKPTSGDIKSNQRNR